MIAGSVRGLSLQLFKQYCTFVCIEQSGVTLNHAGLHLTQFRSLVQNIHQT